MKRNAALFLILSLSILAGAFAQVVPNELLKRDILEKIQGEVSGKICYERIRDLTVFNKWYGSDDMEKAAVQIAARLKTYGLQDARVERFRVGHETYYWMQKPWAAWDCRVGELRMVAPRRELLASMEADSTCVLVNSRDADVTAEVVYVGQGTEARDYEGKDVRGKLVLAYGDPWPVSKIAVFEKGAAGILWGRNLNYTGLKSNVVGQTRIAPWSDDRAVSSTFGFSLSANQSRALLDRIQKGEKVVLEARVRAEVRSPGFHFGTVATIPGTTEPDKEIILTAHLDHPRPGAHDNNSGGGVLLEVARTLRRLIDDGVIPPPRRTLRFYWNPHVWGCQMLYSTYPELLAKTIANINVDCVGIDQTKVSSSFTVVNPPYSRASFLEDIFQNLLNYVAISNNDQWGRQDYGPEILDHDGSTNVFVSRTVPFLGYTDHLFFNSGSVGVPAVNLADMPFVFHHTQKDELGALDPTQLRRICFLTAASCYVLASAGPEEFPRIVDEIHHRSRGRMEMEMKRAKSMLEDATAEDIAGRFGAAGNLLEKMFIKERQSLRSAAVFSGGSRAAGEDLERALAGWDRFEKECMAEIADHYRRLCKKRGLAVRPTVLTKEESELAGIVPVRNLALKGDFGSLNEYPVEKYQFRDIMPDDPFYYELLNYMDGKRTMLEILRFVQAEALSACYQPYSVQETMEYLKLLTEAGIVTVSSKK